MKNCMVCLTLLLSMVSAAGAAEPPAAELLIRDILAKQAEYETITANFTQERDVHIMDEPMLARGRVSFAKPNRMYWVYTEPMEYYLISNGDTLWLYMPEFQQVQYLDMDNNATLQRALDMVSLGSTTIYERLVKYFGVYVSEAEGHLKMTLKPRKGTPAADYLSQVVIRLDPETMLPTVIKAKDINDDELQLEFTDVQTNVEIDPGLFEFIAPEGVEMIRFDGTGIY